MDDSTIHLAIGTSGRGVRVGVVDSGWDRTLKDERVRPGVGLVARDGPLTLEASRDDHDRNGHGTACTDLLLEGAPGVEIIPIRVFDRHLETSPAIVAAAIDWACGRSIDLLNLSLGTVRFDALAMLYRACSRARDAGIIIVAAGANGSTDWLMPAVFDTVIGVGALRGDEKAEVQYRAGASIECRARVSNRRVRGVDGLMRTVTGTSFATPVVTARIARWLEVHPGLDADDIRRLLRGSDRGPGATGDETTRPGQPGSMVC